MLEKNNVIDFTTSLEAVIKFLNDCQVEDTNLHDRLKLIEQELLDIDHEIEFRDMTRSERSQTTDKIKTLRIERRYIKNMIELLAPCLVSARDQAKIIQKLTTLSNKIKEVNNTQANRVYGPRTSNGKASSKIVGKHFTIEKIDKEYKSVIDK